MRIDATRGITPVTTPQAAAGQRPAGDFGAMLQGAIADVNRLQLAADQAAVKLASGEARDFHEVMLITEQANLALQLALQVRNKVLDAYSEIMRMQV